MAACAVEEFVEAETRSFEAMSAGPRQVGFAKEQRRSEASLTKKDAHTPPTRDVCSMLEMCVSAA